METTSDHVSDEIELAHSATAKLRSAATLMEDAQRVANFGSWEWRVDDNSVTWSDHLYRIFGLDPKSFAVTFEAYVERIHPDDREIVVQAITRSATDGTRFRFEHRVVRPNGEERFVRCQGEPVREGGVVKRMVGVCQDVTDLVRSERDRVAADMRFYSAFANAPIGIALVAFEDEADPRITVANRALCELVERDEDELVGSSLDALWHPEDVETDAVLRERLLSGDLDRYSVEKRCVQADGRIVWVELNVSLLPEDLEPARTGIVQMQDVTERKRSEDQLRYIADHDSLTGLLNRRRFRDELESQLALKRRYGGEGALLLLDVDRLKAINDTRGHAAGDAVLRRVGETLVARVRSTDVVGRLAGDEFAVLLPNTTLADAQRLAESLVDRLSEQHVGGWDVSVSLGVAGFGGEDETRDADQVLSEADAAMYRAKDRGGALSELAATTEPADAGDEESAPDPARSIGGPGAADRLRQALASGELHLYAQPVVDLRSERVDHQELLVRMRDESGVIQPASQFLAAAAAEPGLCKQLDRWVVRQAIELLADRESGPRLHVNLSGETLRDPDALDELAAEVTASGVDPHELAFEIAEAAIGEEVDDVEAALGRLAAAGSPLVLDGFSAGFGSFEYLQRLPLGQIKIAGSVVRRLHGETPDHSTVRAIVRLASGTSKTTVAKLVDNEGLVPLLRMHGVDMAQGFQIGEPAPLQGATQP